MKFGSAIKARVAPTMTQGTRGDHRAAVGDRCQPPEHAEHRDITRRLLRTAST